MLYVKDMKRFNEHFGVELGSVLSGLSGSDGSSSFRSCDVARRAWLGSPAARSRACASSVAFAELVSFSLDGDRVDVVTWVVVTKTGRCGSIEVPGTT